VKPKQSAPSTSESVDDYLKAILELGGSEEERVSSNALAERLNVRAASVTGMLQKLAAQRPALVLYERHHGVRLTVTGKRRAWELVRHHRLLELFLHDVLKYSWDEVHEEAERLEHFISERFEDRVAAILGDPEIDPHGHAIPQKNGTGSFQSDVPLNELPLKTPATISSVYDRDAAALRQIERLGIRLGVPIVVERRNANTSMTAHIQGHRRQVRIAKDLAENIFVRPRVMRSPR